MLVSYISAAVLVVVFEFLMKLDVVIKLTISGWEKRHIRTSPELLLYKKKLSKNKTETKTLLKLFFFFSFENKTKNKNKFFELTWKL